MLSTIRFVEKEKIEIPKNQFILLKNIQKLNLFIQGINYEKL